MQKTRLFVKKKENIYDSRAFFKYSLFLNAYTEVFKFKRSAAGKQQTAFV